MVSQLWSPPEMVSLLDLWNNKNNIIIAVVRVVVLDVVGDGSVGVVDIVVVSGTNVRQLFTTLSSNCLMLSKYDCECFPGRFNSVVYRDQRSEWCNSWAPGNRSLSWEEMRSASVYWWTVLGTMFLFLTFFGLLFNCRYIQTVSTHSANTPSYQHTTPAQHSSEESSFISF